MGNSRNRDRQYCERLQRAVERALDNLGNEPKQALMYHLMQTYNISMGGTNCSSLEEIEKALRDMLGEGAAIVMAWIKAEREV